MTPNKSPAALLRCANCGTALGNHSSISFACPTASVGYFTAPVANESRGSVPDDLAGRVHDEIMRLDGGVRRWEDMGESQRAAWRNGLSILTPTPPAVASGEPTAEQDSLIRELRGVVFNYRQRVYLSYAHGAEADSAIAKADAYLASSAAAKENT